MAEEAKRDRVADEAARREARHKRRIKAQVTAYIILVLIVAALAGIGVGLVKALGSVGKGEEKVVENTPAPEENVIDNIIGQEEEIKEPVIEEPQGPTEEELREQMLNEVVTAAVDAMSLEDKVAGLFFVSPEKVTNVSKAVRAGEMTKTALQANPVGGLVYSENNIESETQLKEMIETTKGIVNYSTFIAFTETGDGEGTLTSAKLMDKTDSAFDIGTSTDGSLGRQTGELIGEKLAEYGANVNFAPIADIDGATGNVLEGKTFGASAGIVTPAVCGEIEGMLSKGVSPVVKYFPALSSADADPAAGRAVSSETLESLRDTQFPVYVAAIDSGAGMIQISTCIFEDMDEDGYPATLSNNVVTGILRSELGFNGIVISGNLSDKAITEYYTADQAAVLALRAGCDMLYMPEDYTKAYQGILDAVSEGTISEERINDALKRIYRVKYADRVGEQTEN
ncbi:MAG: hypothetical protein K6G57_09835 [Lachnospiraceae bacterium]|nr:hypothetical protein [Lachnospiraceae bacterium]